MRFSQQLMITLIFSKNHLKLKIYQSISPAKAREKPPANVEKKKKKRKWDMNGG